MGHGAGGPRDAAGAAGPTLSRQALEGVAETLQALAAPSRLRILLHLSRGACSVGEIAVAVAMEQSAVSHQLRVLRHLGLVAGERHGRRIHYRLHDDHVAQLLHEAVYHVEHLRPGAATPPATAAPRVPERSLH